MNKRCYKVIFNKKRSCMMAVAENVHRDGKSMQDSEAASVRVTGAASVSSARAAFGFRMAAFSVMLALGVAAFSPAPASGIIADKSAPKKPTSRYSSDSKRFAASQYSNSVIPRRFC